MKNSIIYLSIIVVTIYLGISGCKGAKIDLSNRLPVDILELVYFESGQILIDIVPEPYCECCILKRKIDSYCEAHLCENDSVGVKLSNIQSIKKLTTKKTFYIELGYFEGDKIRGFDKKTTLWKHPDSYTKNMPDQYILLEDGKKKMPFKAIILDRIALKDAKSYSHYNRGEYLKMSTANRKGKKIKYLFVLITAKMSKNKLGKNTYLPMEIWIPPCMEEYPWPGGAVTPWSNNQVLDLSENHNKI